MSAILSDTDAGRASLGALFRLAIGAGVPKAVEIQLRGGAPLDGRDAFGRSPLMLAASRGHLELCRLLLSRGANISLIDDAGRNAVQLAGSRGHADVARLIEDWVAKAFDVPVVPQRESPVGTSGSDDSVGVSTGASGMGAQHTSAPERSGANVRASSPSASIFGRSGYDDQHPADPVDDRSVTVGTRFTVTESDPAASLPVTHGDTPTTPSAYADQLGWSDGWEPEEDRVLPTSDATVEAAAATIHRELAAHRSVTDDADWSDVEVELPIPRGIWARGFREDFDVVRHLDGLVDAAAFEGRIAAASVVDFLSNTPSGMPDERLERHLVAALEALGILVEDAGPSDPPDGPPAVSSGRAAHDRAISRDVAEFLDDMAAESWSDLGLFELEMRRFPQPPSATAERRLFLEHQEALDRIVVTASRHPAARAVIVEWLRRVTTGDLAPHDLFRHATDDPDSPVDAWLDVPADRSVVDSLQMLVEAIPFFPTATQNRTLADGIISLGLTPARVMEMAQAVCPWGLAARPGARRMATARPGADSHKGDLAASGPAVADAVGEAVCEYLRRRDLIVAMNLRMVLWQARRHFGATLQLADLVQEGTIGLLRAVQGFDPDKGTRFVTYAIWWIRQAMSRYLADTRSTIRIPVHVQDRRSRLGRAERGLVGILGREPHPFELAAALGEPVEAVLRLLQSEMEMVPLYQVVADEQEDPPDGEPVPEPAGLVDSASSPLDTLLHADLRALLERGLGQIDQRLGSIIVLRFGLEDGIPRTLEEIGQLHGVTRERIRQLEVKALARLKRLLPSRSFEALQP